MDRVVEEGVVVGFPEVDGAEGGAADNLVGEETCAGGPGGSVVVVEIVGVRTAIVTIVAGGEDGATGLREDLLESGGGDGATVASP